MKYVLFYRIRSPGVVYCERKNFNTFLNFGRFLPEIDNEKIQLSGSALVSLRIRIRMLDPGAKPMRIHADPDPGQTLKSQKVEFLHEKIL